MSKFLDLILLFGTANRFAKFFKFFFQKMSQRSLNQNFLSHRFGKLKGDNVSCALTFIIEKKKKMQKD